MFSVFVGGWGNGELEGVARGVTEETEKALQTTQMRNINI